MAEYIDKELAIEGMWAGLKEGTICGPEDTETFLRSLPAADVEPVVHAHWYQLDEDILCSHCGKGYMGGDTPQEAKEHLDSGEAYDRCPHCGAHMDREA